MIITARFDSSCPKCGGHIASGTRVEWSKGTKACHVTCPTRSGTPASTPKSPAPKQPTFREPSVTEAPFVRHEKWEPCKRAALPDLTGTVMVAGAFKRSWASLRDGVSDDPAREGEAFFVVAQKAFYESAEDNEDMGDMSGPGWQVALYLRRATATEAAPALEKTQAVREKKEIVKIRKQLIAELEKICADGWLTSDSEVLRPEGPKIVLENDTYGSPRRVAVLSEDGLGVAIWDAGYYDDYRWTLQVSRDPRAVEIFNMLFSGG
jgi:hypothetical protein